MVNYLHKLVNDAVEKDQKVTIDDLIKTAVLNNKELDDAVRELRKAINRNEIDPNHFDKNVLTLTHRNEMKSIIDDDLKDKFDEYLSKLLGQVNSIYKNETGKDLTDEQLKRLKVEISNSKEVKENFENEVSKKSKLITPMDKLKTPFTL